MIERGDLLLVPFPFSDQSGRKVRPVVVISNNEFNEHSEDIIVMGVTSNVSKDRYSIMLTTKQLDEGKLFTNCCIKVENILRLDRGLVIKKIGKVTKTTIGEAISKLVKIFTD